MNKSDLIQAMADKSGLTKADATRAMDALTEIITTALSKGKAEREFALHNIGKFSISKTKARMGRNPRTGEPVKIAAAKRVKFTAAKALKTAANG